MEKRAIRCDNISVEEINDIISDYTSLGWKFIGISEGFPEGYSWIHLEWNEVESPIYPYQEPKS